MNFWASLLIRENQGANEGTIHAWLNWRRKYANPATLAYSYPTLYPSPQTSPSQSQPPVPAPPLRGLSIGVDHGSHLPTPSSASPSPRNPELAFKDEPPPSPIFSSTNMPLSRSSPVSGTFGEPGILRHSRRDSEHGNLQSPATAFSNFTIPAVPARKSSQPSVPPLLFPPVPPAQKPSLADFIRSRHPSRKEFDKTAESLVTNSVEESLQLFIKMGEDAHAAIGRLSKMDGVNHR